MLREKNTNGIKTHYEPSIFICRPLKQGAPWGVQPARFGLIVRIIMQALEITPS